NEINSHFQLSAIRSFRAELRACTTPQEVLMLLLRVAGNVASNGLLIQVDGDELYNLGHFIRRNSCDDSNESREFNEELMSVTNRSLRESFLSKALETSETVISCWPQEAQDNLVNRWLWSRLGAQVPIGARAFIIPVESEGGSLILYGDDLNGKIDFDRLA